MRIAKFLIWIMYQYCVFEHAKFLCKNLNVPSVLLSWVDKSLHYTTIHLAALCSWSAIFHEVVFMNAETLLWGWEGLWQAARSRKWSSPPEQLWWEVLETGGRLDPTTLLKHKACVYLAAISWRQKGRKPACVNSAVIIMGATCCAGCPTTAAPLRSLQWNPSTLPLKAAADERMQRATVGPPWLEKGCSWSPAPHLISCHGPL